MTQPILNLEYRESSDLMSRIEKAEREHRPRAKLRAELSEQRHAQLRRELGPKSKRRRAA